MEKPKLALVHNKRHDKKKVKKSKSSDSLSSFKQEILEGFVFFNFVWGYTNIAVADIACLFGIKAPFNDLRSCLLNLEDQGYISIIYDNDNASNDRIEFEKYPAEYDKKFFLRQRDKEFLKQVYKIQEEKGLIAGYDLVAKGLRMGPNQKEFFDTADYLESIGLIINGKNRCYLKFLDLGKSGNSNVSLSSYLPQKVRLSPYQQKILDGLKLFSPCFEDGFVPGHYLDSFLGKDSHSINFEIAIKTLFNSELIEIDDQSSPVLLKPLFNERLIVKDPGFKSLSFNDAHIAALVFLKDNYRVDFLDEPHSFKTQIPVRLAVLSRHIKRGLTVGLNPVKEIERLAKAGYLIEYLVDGIRCFDLAVRLNKVSEHFTWAAYANRRVSVFDENRNVIYFKKPDPRLNPQVYFDEWEK